MQASEDITDITTWTECVLYGLVGGISLLTKMLLLQDEGVELAAVAALAVVTAANDHNCRCVVL